MKLAWQRSGLALTTLLIGMLVASCNERSPTTSSDRYSAGELEQAFWAFHSADTSRDAEAVIGLMWPELEMLVDGERLDHARVVAGAREFMGSIDVFATDWTDLRIISLDPDHAVTSFMFRDSIVTNTDRLIQSWGPTTFVWQRRNGEWRVLFADADHYPMDD